MSAATETGRCFYEELGNKHCGCGRTVCCYCEAYRKVVANINAPSADAHP
jgi:hypothetical protein